MATHPCALASLLFAVCLAIPAYAQTELNLSATGQALAEPDEMTASLQVQATAASAAAAQSAVNKAMQQALGLAKSTPGVTATTDSYNVVNTAQDNTKPAIFQASQSLELVIPAPGGTPPAPFTGLVGKLQQNGLLLNGLDGDLSNASQQKSQQSAIGDALDQIQAQAAIIAAKLNEHVGAIKSLNVNINAPMPLGRAIFALAAAAPAPQAAPGKITVQANVSATVELTSH